MNVKILNKICFALCIICIVLGTVLSLYMIWAEAYNEHFIVKSWLTLAVFFLTALITLSVSKAFGDRLG
jgi:hypothetical protein